MKKSVIMILLVLIILSSCRSYIDIPRNSISKDYLIFKYENDYNNFIYSTKTYSETHKYKTITVGARGTYHFFTKEKFDCYASIGLGFNINTASRTTDNPNGYTSYASARSGVYSAFTVGIRYYFTKNFGVYSELGWDNSTPIQAGLALKF